MTRAAEFQGSRVICMRFMNVFRETQRTRRCIAPLVGLLASVAMTPVSAAEHDVLSIGITQFPATLNPSIDVMAAKSYVLGAALRPFTVYDAEWKLACLLCTELPSIGNGLAVTVDLLEGKKGIDLTYTIRPDARWAGDRRSLLGADHVFPRADHSRGRGVQDPHGLPSPRPRRAERRHGSRRQVDDLDS